MYQRDVNVTRHEGNTRRAFRVSNLVFRFVHNTSVVKARSFRAFTTCVVMEWINVDTFLSSF